MIPNHTGSLLVKSNTSLSPDLILHLLFHSWLSFHLHQVMCIFRLSIKFFGTWNGLLDMDFSIVQMLTLISVVILILTGPLCWYQKISYGFCHVYWWFFGLLAFKGTRYCLIEFCKAEYRAMCMTTKEIIWISQVLRDLCVLFSPPTYLYCDNTTPLHIARNHVFHEPNILSLIVIRSGRLLKEGSSRLCVFGHMINWPMFWLNTISSSISR